MVNSAGAATQLANITNETAAHLEGVITATNYGPWASKIITGAESKTPPLVHTVDTNGVVVSFEMGIEPEDFDIIQPSQNLYCLDQGSTRKIVKLSSSLLTNYLGDLLVTQEGERHQGTPPRLFILHWDATNSTFFTRCIPYANLFEHVTFAPIEIPDLP